MPCRVSAWRARTWETLSATSALAADVGLQCENFIKAGLSFDETWTVLTPRALANYERIHWRIVLLIGLDPDVPQTFLAIVAGSWAWERAIFDCSVNAQARLQREGNLWRKKDVHTAADASSTRAPGSSKFVEPKCAVRSPPSTSRC